MTTSGTYSFNPSLGEVVLNAFARCGIRRTSLAQEHMSDARFEANLMFGAVLNSRGPSLYETLDQLCRNFGAVGPELIALVDLVLDPRLNHTLVERLTRDVGDFD